MKELKANLWEVEADIRIITTNGFVKKNGKAVMGRGCAKEAALKYPSFPDELGFALKIAGNRVFPMEFGEDKFLTMPVKHNWWEKADISLIKKSIKEIVELVDLLDEKTIVMPRPGCGNGQLNWEDVKSVIEPYLDDRFTVVSFEGE